MTTGDRYCGCGSGLIVWQCPCKSGGTTKQWGDIRIQDPKMEEMLEQIAALKDENALEVVAKNAAFAEISRLQKENNKPCCQDEISQLYEQIATLKAENAECEREFECAGAVWLEVAARKEQLEEEVVALKAEKVSEIRKLKGALNTIMCLADSFSNRYDTQKIQTVCEEAIKND